MMSTEQFNENDIEILDDCISVKNTLFSKKQIADTFNELVFAKKVIEQNAEDYYEHNHL